MTQAPWHITLRLSLRALSYFFWPPTPEQEEREYQVRLVQELHIRQQLLINLCRRLQLWRDRLEQRQKEQLRLASQIQTHADHGKEVETQRSARALERNRKAQVRIDERLQRLERKYQSAQRRFEQLKRQRGGSSGAG
jgi:hypothetical protein